MVATILPAPHQLSLLPAPSAPAVQDAVVIQDAAFRRMMFYLRRMCYGDALVSGSFRLERQLMQVVNEDEDGSAPDDSLVQTSYVEFIVYALTPQARAVMGGLVQVVEVRTQSGEQKKTPVTRKPTESLFRRMTVKLLQYGWQIDQTRYLPDGALTTTYSGVAIRAPRLLKEQR